MGEALHPLTACFVVDVEDAPPYTQARTCSVPSNVFIAVSQLRKCVFWLKPGSCIVGNIDYRRQAINACHGCALLPSHLNTDKGNLFKNAQAHLKNLCRFLKLCCCKVQLNSTTVHLLSLNSLNISKP